MDCATENPEFDGNVYQKGIIVAILSNIWRAFMSNQRTTTSVKKTKLNRGIYFGGVEN